MLALISVNYKTSPTEIREQVHISENEISLLHKFIQKKILLDGLFIISTLNASLIAQKNPQLDLENPFVYQ